MDKKIYLCLGTNIGNRKKNLETAIEKIAEFAKIIKKSSIYETEPVNYKNQPYFLNLVIKIKTQLTPLELLSKLQTIENKMGRTRKIKKGPRIIDLDILFYNNKIIHQKNLKIPHPALHKRNFILTPLKEIASSKIHPRLHKSIKILYKNLKNPEKVNLWTSKK